MISSGADLQVSVSRQQQYVLRSDAVSWREVDGEIVALDIASGAYFSVNGAGRVLWKSLVDPVSVDDLAIALSESFSIPKEQAASDAAAFVDDLLERQLAEALV